MRSLPAGDEARQWLRWDKDSSFCTVVHNYPVHINLATSRASIIFEQEEDEIVV